MYQEYDNVSRLKFYMSKTQLKSTSMGVPQYVDVVITFFFFIQKKRIFLRKEFKQLLKRCNF